MCLLCGSSTRRAFKRGLALGLGVAALALSQLAAFAPGDAVAATGGEAKSVTDAAVIEAQSTSSFICPANPCQMLPVTLNRGDATPVLGFSVTIQLSGNLSLCAGTGSITEGTFLSSAGPTTFLIIDNGGGSYTIDDAVLGSACGPTLLSGTLFNVGVTSGDPGGSGSITVTSVTLRDCVNLEIPSVAGGAGTVPIDNQAPVVTVISPNGGETWSPGSPQKITWLATDNTGVANVDIDYSTDGGATYPVVVATAAPNTGSFVWTSPGPPTAQGRIRVTAHDVACSSGADASDADFTRDPLIVSSAGPNGAIAPLGSTTVPYGGSQAYTITANACYAVADVLVDGGSVGAVTTYTFNNVTADHTIAASFVSTTQATTTALTVSPSPSVCQEPVTLTATLLPASATGSVDFFDGVTLLGSAPVISGSATLPNGPLSVGAHTLKAVFTPTGCFTASQDTRAHTVNKANVTIALTSDINPSIWNQAVTFTATVTPPTATGSVVFKDSLTTLGTVPLAGGSAQIVKSNLFTGLHGQVTAQYLGDACYNAKLSGNYAQLVYRAPSSVSVTSDINPSTCGQTIKLIATVSPVGGTNRVEFSADGNLIGTGGVNALTGIATLNVNNLLPGKHLISVHYQGDAHFEPSNSAADYSQTVDPAPSSVTLASDLNPAKYGAKVNLTATVTPSDAQGSVGFFDGATSIGSAPVAAGVATLSITTELAAGSHDLTAVYSGDLCNGASTSPILTQVITPDAPPQVTVLFPNGHETLCIDGDIKLLWTATDNTAITSVRLEISRDFGASWETIVASMANTGTYVWRVTGPGTNSGTTEIYSALFKVTATDNVNLTGSDQSDDYFSIFDCVVATTITQMEAEPVDLGVQIKWAFANRSAFSSVVLERSPAESGPWAQVSAEVSDAGGATVAVDRSAEAGQTYFYRLVGTTAAGSRAVFGPVKGTAGAPREFALSAAWPNPTRGPVSMTFSLPRSAHVSLSVVDLQGREVSSLANADFKAGRYQVDWDGRSDRGPVPAGLYFVRFVTPERKLVSRVAITR